MGMKLTVEGDGVRIEREITETQLVKLLGVLTNESVPETRGSASVQSVTSPRAGESGGRQPALGEYLAGLNPDGNAEHITAMLLYAADHGGETSLSTEQINNAFVTARRKPPGNIHRDIATAAKRGWIAEEPSRPGLYYATDTGRNALTGSDRSRASNGRTQSARANGSSASAKRSRKGKPETYELVDLGLDKEQRAALAAFYAEKNPSVQNDQVAVVMYWLLANTGRRTVSRADIFTALRLAKGRVPARISSVIANLRIAGMVVGDGDELSLHHLGEDMVEQDLPRAMTA